MGNENQAENLAQKIIDIIEKSDKKPKAFDSYDNNGFYFSYNGKYYKSSSIAIRKVINCNDGLKANKLLKKLGFEVHNRLEIKSPELKNSAGEGQCIILNKMFTGGYLLNDNNIGHEIINLFEADDSNVYLYLNSMGTVKLGKLRKNTSMLMVKKVPRERKLKVIALAKNLELVDGATYRDIAQATENQSFIKYDGIPAATIMANNRLPGRDGANIIATFVTTKENIRVPTTPIFLSWGSKNDEEVCMSGNFPSTTMRAYYYDNYDTDVPDKGKGFDSLNKLITDDKNDEKWKKPTENGLFSKVEEINSTDNDENFNIFRVSGNEDDELSFSNMLAFFLKDSDLCKHFFKELIDLEVEDSNSQREEFDIDIIVRGKGNIIAIENKIHSSINGEITKQEEADNKIQKWDNAIWKNEDGVIQKHDAFKRGESDKGKIVSQLAKYYMYAKSRMKIENNSKDEPKMILLCPDYAQNKISEKVLKNNYLYGDKYSVVYYSRIKDILEKYYDSKEEKHSDQFFVYLKEFLKAMNKHTKDEDNNYEEEMRRRFENQIYRIKRNR